MSKYTKPKILFLDIETCPIIADVWKLWDNNVGLNQIIKDWSIIAWAEMRKYNPLDPLATEELYEKILAWDSGLNVNAFHKMHDSICVCGSHNFIERGHRYTNTGKFKRYKCKDCGKEWQSKDNLLSIKKRREMLK